MGLLLETCAKIFIRNKTIVYTNDANMPFVSDYDDNNYQSGVNAQDSLVENIKTSHLRIKKLETK